MDALTKSVQAMMRKHCIKRNRSYLEYERGKQVVIYYSGLNPDKYYQAIQIVAKWVGV